jgi:hypothetical protein
VRSSIIKGKSSLFDRSLSWLIDLFTARMLANVIVNQGFHVLQSLS